jgi:hypothetical protein
MSAITIELHNALEKDGARARALGRSQFDNPFLKSENMPAATGHSLEEWNAKRDAWQMGWTIEDAMRGRR